MKYLSERIKSLSESETLSMSRRSRELKAKGFDVINLSIGEPDFNTPEFVKDQAKKALDENYTHYSPVAGYPELREAIAEKLKRDNGLTYTSDQIVVSTGAKQALANVILCMVNPGEEVIIPTPYWVSYREIVKLAKGKPIYVESSVQSNFKVTAAQIEAAITANTKLLLLNSPSNPSGAVYSFDELKSIAQVLERHPHVFVISDEIYEYINFEGKHCSLASFENIYDRVIVINGLSKGFAMTGWRIGYVAAHKEIAKACEKYQGQITSGTCSVAQRAAIEAFKADPKNNKDLKQMVDAFLYRRDLLLNLLNKIPGLKLNVPQGAFYVFPEVSSYFGKSFNGEKINNGEDLCNYLLNEAHVATVPGSAFGMPQCIRLSYAASEELLRKAMERIEKALKNLQ